MAYNGAGIFNRLYSWVADAANGIDILSTRMDNEMDGFATGLSNAVTRDGQSPFLANIPAGGFKITGLANPTLAQDAATKFYVDGTATTIGGEIDDIIDGTTLLQANLEEGVWKISGVAVLTSAAEINILNGVLVTTAELNLLDGLVGIVGKTSDTGSALVPSGTTAQRDGAPVTGMLRYNSTLTTFEGYNGTGWGPVGGGGQFKGNNGTVGIAPGDIFRVNSQTLTQNTTIGATENASATGPLAVDTGVTLTVATGGTLAVI